MIIFQLCETRFLYHHILTAGPLGYFSTKAPSYQYTDSHYDDKMVSQLSYHYDINHLFGSVPVLNMGEIDWGLIQYEDIILLVWGFPL